MADWKSILGGIAPTIATVLGGPLAGLAVDAIGKAIGMDAPTVSKVQDALTRGQLTGDQIAAIRQAEIAVQTRLKELDIDLARIDADDRNSARQREASVRDWIPGIMAVGVSVGFFGVLGWLLNYGIPHQGGEALLVMLGSLGTAWASIIAYYFGSSAGSAQKTTELANLAGKARTV